jgi:hypothetical protein
MRIRVYDKPGAKKGNRNVVNYITNQKTGYLEVVTQVLPPIPDPQRIVSDLYDVHKNKFRSARASKNFNGMTFDIFYDSDAITDLLNRLGFEYDVEGGITIEELSDELNSSQVLTVAQKLFSHIKNENSILEDHQADAVRNRLLRGRN